MAQRTSAASSRVERAGPIERHARWAQHGPRLGLEEKSGPTAIPAKGQRPGHREASPVPPVWIRTGVSPRGAHVRRTTGCCEISLSSSKTSHACRRRAFFFLRPPPEAVRVEYPLTHPPWFPHLARARIDRPQCLLHSAVQQWSQ